MLEVARATNWTTLDDLQTVDDLWNGIKNAVLHVTEEAVPKIVPQYNDNKKWFTHKHKRALASKNQAFLLWKQENTEESYQAYKRERNRVRNFLRRSRRRFETKLTAKAAGNSKHFFSYMRQNRQLRTEITAMTKPDGSLTNDPAEQGEILKDFYSSVYRRDVDHPPAPQLRSVSPPMQMLVISSQQTETALRRLDINKGAGPDGLHPKILRLLAEFLADPLTRLFNLTLTTANIPYDWKNAIVGPIHKKGDKTQAENYRPISLTSVVCKLMERILKKAILTHPSNIEAISLNQHGFVAGKSCLSNLLETEEFITRQMDSKETVDVVFIDFSKAFDSVNHRLLSHKLSAYGLHPQVRAWIDAFLYERKLQVQVKGVKTDPLIIHSGVPQGSVLGPILFLLYINDINEDSPVKSLMYADDLKLIAPRSRWSELEHAIHNIGEWSNLWDFPINARKCSLLSIGDPAVAELRFEEDSSIPIPMTQSALDLGIEVDSSFKPSAQCLRAVNKARGLLFCLKRAFDRLTPDIFIPWYDSIIRPNLDYGIQACSPYLRRDIIHVERLQRLATRMVHGLHSLPYEDRLRRLNLFSLERRRLRGDLITTYNIFSGQMSIPLETFFTFPSRPNLRGHRWKVAQPAARLQRRRCCFSVRVCAPWSKLPDDVINSTSLTMFKARLDAAWPVLFPNLI